MISRGKTVITYLYCEKSDVRMKSGGGGNLKLLLLLGKLGSEADFSTSSGGRGNA